MEICTRNGERKLLKTVKFECGAEESKKKITCWRFQRTAERASTMPWTLSIWQIRSGISADELIPLFSFSRRNFSQTSKPREHGKLNNGLNNKNYLNFKYFATNYSNFTNQNRLSQFWRTCNELPLVQIIVNCSHKCIGNSSEIK